MTRAEAIRKVEYGLEMETTEQNTFGQLTVVSTEALKMARDALRAQQGHSPADQTPPDRFLAQTKWGGVVLVERRSWGDRDWLVGGLYIPKDIVWWWPLPEPVGGAE